MQLRTPGVKSRKIEDSYYCNWVGCNKEYKTPEEAEHCFDRGIVGPEIKPGLVIRETPWDYLVVTGESSLINGHHRGSQVAVVTYAPLVGDKSMREMELHKMPFFREVLFMSQPKHLSGFCKYTTIANSIIINKQQGHGVSAKELSRLEDELGRKINGNESNLSILISQGLLHA